jgi:ATP-binding cassette subfamily F protein 3
MGDVEPLQGQIRLGANVTAGYFSQDASDLDPDMTPLETMVWDMDMEPQPARDLLGRFLFSGDDVMRPVKSLSGGEKNKLSLAKLTQFNPNLLILDEPTNHLDMDSRDALAEVLKRYQGTLILVSHDRWLLSQITDHTLDIRRSGPVAYPGSYTEYRAWTDRGRPVQASPAKADPAPKPSEGMTPRELSKEIQRVEKLVSELESQIGILEEQLRNLESTLSNVSPTADILALTREHANIQEQLAGTMAAWEEHSLRLERLRSLQ